MRRIPIIAASAWLLLLGEAASARQYDPEVGRFLQEDPVSGDFARPQTQHAFAYIDSVEKPQTNAYQYAENNPIRFTDPLGLYSEEPFAYFYDIDNFSQGSANLSAGFGDTLTSGFGLTHLVGLPSLTQFLRQNWSTAGYGDSVSGCSGFYKGGQVAAWAWLAGFNYAGYTTGYEFTLGKRYRLAPWGNRTGHPYGELPHFHRPITGPGGKPIPGGSYKWHRPWEKGW